MCFACCKKSRQSSEAPKNEVPLIYRNEAIDDVFEGVSYIFTGSLKPNKRLFINLIPDDITKDIALLLHPSRSQDCLVASTRSSNIWIEEKQYSPLPSSFKLGFKFCIQILVTEASYMIAVNGYHLAEYNHKMNFRWVRCIEVTGDAKHLLVIRSVVGSYPHRLDETQAKNVPHVSNFIANVAIKNDINVSTALVNEQEEFPMPYIRSLPTKSFTVGRCLKINGRILKKPHSFSISLQRDQDVWPFPVVAFRFKAIFELEQFFCSGAYYNQQWSVEESAELGWYTDLMPGGEFALFIVARETVYDVYLNAHRIISFRHRVEPEYVDTLYIQGDIVLLNVVLKTRYFSE